MVRSSLKNGLFVSIGHFLNASLGTQLVRLHGMPFCAICYLERKNLRPSRCTLGGSGTQSTTTVWTSLTPCPSRQSPPPPRPEEEAWLDVHLDELVAKGVIGPIFPG